MVKELKILSCCALNHMGGGCDLIGRQTSSERMPEHAKSGLQELKSKNKEK
jgi:hypothetical protein